jgi:hypothetical protein
MYMVHNCLLKHFVNSLLCRLKCCDVPNFKAGYNFKKGERFLCLCVWICTYSLHTTDITRQKNQFNKVHPAQLCNIFFKECILLCFSINYF